MALSKSERNRLENKITKLKKRLEKLQKEMITPTISNSSKAKTKELEYYFEKILDSYDKKKIQDITKTYLEEPSSIKKFMINEKPFESLMLQYKHPKDSVLQKSRKSLFEIQANVEKLYQDILYHHPRNLN